MIEGQPIFPALDRHSFRGQFLDCFALIEDHVAPVIDRLVALGLAKKAPHLFGQKFDLIRRNIAAQSVWRNCDHVGPIFEDLAPFAALRGLMGHGLIKQATLAEGEALSIEPPGYADWSERKVLTAAECHNLLAKLHDLTKRLLKQRTFTGLGNEA